MTHATLCNHPIHPTAPRAQRLPLDKPSCYACVQTWTALPMAEVLTLRQRPDGVIEIGGVWHVGPVPK